MPQTKICSYRQTPCDRTHTSASPASFLILSEGLRHKIYEDAGLISGDVLRIVKHNGSLQEKREWRLIHAAAVLNISGSSDAPVYAVTEYSIADIEENETVNMQLKASLNLSLTSRQVRADVARFLCSQNEILLCCEEHTDLNLLYGMPTHLVKTLKRLTLHLDFASTHDLFCRKYGSCCHHDHHDWDEETHFHNQHKPLKSTSETFIFFMLHWRIMMSYIASHAVESRLQLRIYANVDNTSAAEQMVEPVELIGFAVRQMRLSGDQSPALRNITSRVVNTTSQVKTRPFHFLDLPPELRQHVLSFTSIVTPRLKIHVFRGTFAVLGNPETVPRCSRSEFCSLAHDLQPKWKHYDTPVWPPCDCWMHPSPIFLVCREMLKDARALFFSAHHFNVRPDRSIVAQYWRFEASFFIGHVVPMEALSSLRSLELNFPAKFYDIFGPNILSGLDEVIYADWKATVTYMASRIRRLKLRLHMGARDYASLLTPSGDLEQALERVFHVNIHIVRPLQNLHSIDHFEVSAHWPFQPVAFEQFDRLAKLREHEIHLETLVMGGRGEDMLAEEADLSEMSGGSTQAPDL